MDWAMDRRVAQGGIALVIALFGTACPEDSGPSSDADVAETGLDGGGSDADGTDVDDGGTIPGDADGTDAGDTVVADVRDGGEVGDVDVPSPVSTEHFEWVRYGDGEFGRSVYTDITTGPDGHLYVVGRAQSPPGQPTWDDVPPGGVVVKLAPDGTFQWAHHVDSSGPNRLTAVEVDASGTVFAVGWGEGDSDFWSDHTAYLLALTADGELEARHEILASGTARPKEFGLVDGDPVVAGEADGFDESAGAGRDAFLARFDGETATGENVESRWTTFLGSDRADTARSLTVTDTGDIRVYMPVVHGDATETASDGKLYAVTGQGEINGANSLPLPGGLFDIGLRDGRVFLGGFAAKRDGEDTDVFVAGGTPVYPTTEFSKTFGEDLDDVATDLAVEAGPAGWYVGRQNVDRDADTSEAFAVRYTWEGERTREVVFGDANPAGVSPRAVTVDSQGRIFIAGGTRTAFGGDEFAARATFVGRLAPESGP